MARYIKNADLTVEHIIRRAFALGANRVYTNLLPGNHKSIVIDWPVTGPICYAMEEYKVNGWQMSFSNNLPSLRRAVEQQGYIEKLTSKGWLEQVTREFEQVPSYVERFKGGREPVE